VCPRAGLDTVEKSKILPLPGLERRLFYRPARTQSLYQQRYPSFPLTHCRSGKGTAQEGPFALIPLLLRVYPLPRESVYIVHATGIEKMQTFA
jgi:hypothetical protein